MIFLGGISQGFATYLCSWGFLDVEWHEYDDGGHWINEPQGVDDFVAFLRRTMGE
ncbi:hypothetical protein QBC41DRAFT_235826 [Cercophora samala]|uniref:Alpha/beta hydrolase n=1 Tax=Cercophora samala TaxID=330535 RepID=A0AA39YZT0_9PEZI|nr:hypothetical protein QBC41DRAFT_235826 [Cercophora samala]